MPTKLRRLLHSPLDQLSDPRDARWESGRPTLYSAGGRPQLPSFRSARAPYSLP